MRGISVKFTSNCNAVIVRRVTDANVQSIMRPRLATVIPDDASIVSSMEWIIKTTTTIMQLSLVIFLLQTWLTLLEATIATPAVNSIAWRFGKNLRIGTSTLSAMVMIGCRRGPTCMGLYCESLSIMSATSDNSYSSLTGSSFSSGSALAVGGKLNLRWVLLCNGLKLTVDPTTSLCGRPS